MLKEKRVLYLISRENVLAPGVIKSQALDLLGEAVSQNSRTQVTVLNFPSLHRFIRYIGYLPKVIKDCRQLGIRLVIIPILPIGRSVMPFWAIPFFLIQVVPFVAFFLIKDRINIIHSRSYLSALAAWFTTKIFKKVRFIFDMRAPYLMEGLILKRWEKTDFSYQLWEKLEKQMFTDADAVVAQATGMAGYVKKICPQAKITYIPNCVNFAKYKVTAEEREKGRAKFNIADRFVFVYSGSFGNLHPAEFGAQLYSRLRKFVDNPFFLIATYSNPLKIRESLLKEGVPPGEFQVLKNPPNLARILPLGDAGISAMRGEILTTPLVLSVKVPEYLAAGLPLIGSGPMQSVAEIIEKERCGVVVNHLDQKDARVKMQQLVREHKTMRKNALKLAQNQFSVEACALKYLAIYNEILAKSNR